jgi:hypothetical protein
MATHNTTAGGHTLGTSEDEALQGEEIERRKKREAIEQVAATQPVASLPSSSTAAAEEEAELEVPAVVIGAASESAAREERRPASSASASENAIETPKRAGNLGANEFVIPLSVATRYSAVDGKYFAKDGKKDTVREMFRDHGEKLTTSTTDKAAIADMVAVAKAKQWPSFKLSGDREFRREAWLQFESQGLRTTGYTPREVDLAELRTLTAERSTNRIEAAEIDLAGEAKGTRLAPRSQLNKSQSSIHTEAAKSLAANAVVLRDKLKDRQFEDVAKLAYWRGVVMEENKYQPAAVQSEVLARFDEQAKDPEFLKTIENQTHATLDDKTIDRVEKSLKRDTPEHTL